MNYILIGISINIVMLIINVVMYGYSILNRLKRIVEILENVYYEDNEEDEPIEYIHKVYDLTRLNRDYPEIADLIKNLVEKQHEIIDRMNGE